MKKSRKLVGIKETKKIEREVGQIKERGGKNEKNDGVRRRKA